jgi:hypothetical protein
VNKNNKLPDTHRRFSGKYVPKYVPFLALWSISHAYGSDDMLDQLRDKLTEALVNAGVMEG